MANPKKKSFPGDEPASPLPFYWFAGMDKWSIQKPVEL
jgi:hypothetical protein